MNHESLLKLIGELTAQRDDYVAWQGEAMRVIGKLVEGQPEIQPGVGALTVLEQYVGRLLKEKAALETALAVHAESERMHEALRIAEASVCDAPGA